MRRCSGFSRAASTGTWCERHVPSTGTPSTSFGPVQPFGVRRTISGHAGRPLARLAASIPSSASSSAAAKAWWTGSGSSPETRSGLEAARRRERASEIALLLGLTRIGVLLVGAGLVLAVACGFWLLDLTEFDLGDVWVLAALGLIVVGALLGSVGGRRPRQARLLADRGGDTAELRRPLRGRPSTR